MLQGIDRLFAARRQALERCFLPPRLWRAANVAGRLFTPPLRSYRRRMSPLLARMRPAGRADQCPQLGVERTQRGRRLWAVHDPDRS
jgi:hypothetical protein